MGGSLGVPCATRPPRCILLHRELCAQVVCSHLRIILPLLLQGWLGTSQMSANHRDPLQSALDEMVPLLLCAVQGFGVVWV